MLPVGSILDTSQGDSVLRGSAVTAAVGLAVLPFEPITGMTLLTSGLGVATAKVKGALSNSENRACEAMSQLDDTSAKLEAAQNNHNVARGRASQLEVENSRLRYGLLSAGCACAVLYVYNNYSRKAPSTIRIGNADVPVFQGPPSPYEPQKACNEGEKICNICFENTVDTLILPCRHAQTCWECTMNLLEPICPFCREEMTQLQHVFL